MSHNAIIPAQPSRLRYLDAIRGFSMFLVVFGHVLFMSAGLEDKDSYLNTVLAAFRMPMFFFVSGIVAYKPIAKWTFPYAFSILKRKFQAQIIGTIFFYTLLLLALHDDDPFKAFRLEVGGYWFTLALFRIFLIYAILTLVFKRVGENFTIGVMVALALLGIYLYHTLSFGFGLFQLIGYNPLYYLQFFTFGLLLRKYGFGLIDRCSRNNAISALAIAFCVLSILVFVYDQEISAISGWGYYILSAELLRYTGLVFVFGMFYRFRNAFEADNKVNRVLQLVGRRTLDIYFIHYFFVPKMPWLKPYLADVSNSVVPQLLIGVTFAGVIVAICIGISSVLRLSPVLAQWLFGVKRAPAKQPQA